MASKKKPKKPKLGKAPKMSASLETFKNWERNCKDKLTTYEQKLRDWQSERPNGPKGKQKKRIVDTIRQLYTKAG